MAAPTTAPNRTRKLCTNCGENPRAVVSKQGRRVRTKLCHGCLRDRLAARARRQSRASKTESQHDRDAQQEVTNLCGARKKNGTTCSNTAGAGTDHPGFGQCKWHGGSTPNSRKAAAKMQAVAHATVMGAPVDIEPHDALLWCVRIAAGEVAYCNLMVASITKADAVGPRKSVKVRPLSEGKDGESPYETVQEVTYSDPSLHIWIAVRQQALERLAKFSKLAIDAGIAERQVQLTERWGELLGRCIGGILDGLKLTEAQQRRAPELVRTHLTAIEGQATEEVA